MSVRVYKDASGNFRKNNDIVPSGQYRLVYNQDQTQAGLFSATNNDALVSTRLITEIQNEAGVGYVNAAALEAALEGFFVNASVEGASVNGVRVYSTYSLMVANPEPELQTSYKVSNDTDSSLNGYYHWDGSLSYIKDADLANGVVEEGNVDAVSGDKINTAINGFKSISQFEGGYLNETNGTLIASGTRTASDFLDVTKLLTLYDITAISAQNFCYACLYTDSEVFVTSLYLDNGGGTSYDISEVKVKALIDANPTAKLIRVNATATSSSLYDSVESNLIIINEQLPQIAINEAAIGDLQGYEKDIDVSGLILHDANIAANTGEWNNVGVGTLKLIFAPATEDGRKALNATMIANSGIIQNFYTFVKSETTPVNGESPDYCDGFFTRIDGILSDTDIPSDCNFIILRVAESTTVYYPDLLTFFLQGDFGKVEDLIKIPTPLTKDTLTVGWTSGSLSPTGVPEVDPNSEYSDLIPIEENLFCKGVFGTISSKVFWFYKANGDYVSNYGTYQDEQDIALTLELIDPSAFFFRVVREITQTTEIFRLLASENVISSAYGNTLGVFGGSHEFRPESHLAKAIWNIITKIDTTTYGEGGNGYSSLQGTKPFPTGQITEAIADTPKDIYLLWLSTNDYTNDRVLGVYTDYINVAIGDYTEQMKETYIGGMIYGIKKLIEFAPSSKIAAFTPFKFFSGSFGYDPADTTLNGDGKTFKQYEEEAVKAFNYYGIPYLDQSFGNINIDNYTGYFKADNLHMWGDGYLRIVMSQIDFFNKV